MWFVTKVWDDDHGNHNDNGEKDALVDKYNQMLEMKPAANQSVSYFQYFLVKGKGTVLTLYMKYAN